MNHAVGPLQETNRRAGFCVAFEVWQIVIFSEALVLGIRAYATGDVELAPAEILPEVFTERDQIFISQFIGQVGNRAIGERLHVDAGMDRARIAAALVLTAPFIPMLFQGEEWAASTPFQYFADHEDEEMRAAVAEGRRMEFSHFGFGGDVPNPEDIETFDRSKLDWNEVHEGKHGEMLEWTKSLIALRRSTISLNDGSMHEMIVATDEDRKTLVLERCEVRVLANLGKQACSFDLLEGEELKLASRPEIQTNGGSLELPALSLAVLISPMEMAENRRMS